MQVNKKRRSLLDLNSSPPHLRVSLIFLMLFGLVLMLSFTTRTEDHTDKSVIELDTGQSNSSTANSNPVLDTGQDDISTSNSVQVLDTGQDDFETTNLDPVLDNAQNIVGDNNTITNTTIIINIDNDDLKEIIIIVFQILRENANALILFWENFNRRSKPR